MKRLAVFVMLLVAACQSVEGAPIDRDDDAGPDAADASDARDGR